MEIFFFLYINCEPSGSRFGTMALIPLCRALSAGQSTQSIFHFHREEKYLFQHQIFFSFKFCAVKDGLLVKYLEFASLLNLAPAPAPAPAFPSLAPEGALLPAPIFHPADQQVCWP